MLITARSIPQFIVKFKTFKITGVNLTDLRSLLWRHLPYNKFRKMECVRGCDVFWLVSRAKSTTVTKCSALECCLYTFALMSATLSHWTTSQKFSSSLCSFWQSCPAYFPTIWFLPCPAPITCRWKFWSCNHYLAPAVTSLVSCLLSVLYGSCLCCGNTFYWSALMYRAASRPVWHIPSCWCAHTAISQISAMV